MPRHAPELECSAEDKASLLTTTKSRTEEARAVERARIILACLEGKEIQQVARELGVSIPTVAKWRKRFALWGPRGLRDQRRPGKPATYDAAFRNRVLALLEQPPPSGMSHWDGPAVAEYPAPRGNLPAEAAQLVREYRPAPPRSTADLDITPPPRQPWEGLSHVGSRRRKRGHTVTAASAWFRESRASLAARSVAGSGRSQRSVMWKPGGFANPAAGEKA